MGVIKTKVTKADVVVRGTKERPYYVIVYHELGKEYDNEGFGSYSLENVLGWRNEYLELIEEGKEVAKEGTKTLECKACGTRFSPTLERHYVARDCTETGMAAAIGRTKEALWFDAFDCPVCGCQIIAQARKRTVDSLCSEVECDCEECADWSDCEDD